MRTFLKYILHRFLIAWCLLVAGSLQAQDAASYKSKPKGHENNKLRAIDACENNLKKFANDSNKLVLPGLLADKKEKRVEVMVESTRLSPTSPCEFTIIAETSDHAYETLLIAFAKPSDVHKALQFIGVEPGEPYDPASLRYWAKGEPFVLSLLRSNEAPFRLEKLLLDRRTGKTLPEEGFLFTGSRMMPDAKDPGKKVYAADEYQPKSIVSLFNDTFSVLAVPYSAAKGAVYQNTIINPEHELTEGELLTLMIEPANKDGSKRGKDLVLQVESNNALQDKPLTDADRLASLSFQLKDSGAILNEKPTILSVIGAMAALDRKKHAYYVNVRFGDKVELGQAQAFAKILSTIDCERGVLVEPPTAGQLYYRAFTPDDQLLDREARFVHPWELSLAGKDGRVSGKLLLVNSVWKTGAAASVLEMTELPVSSPLDLGRELEAEAKRIGQPGKTAKPPVIMVYAPSHLQYGQLLNFLEPVLSTHKVVHLYLDIPMATIPAKKTSK